MQRDRHCAGSGTETARRRHCPTTALHRDRYHPRRYGIGSTAAPAPAPRLAPHQRWGWGPAPVPQPSPRVAPPWHCTTPAPHHIGITLHWHRTRLHRCRDRTGTTPTVPPCWHRTCPGTEAAKHGMAPRVPPARHRPPPGLPTPTGVSVAPGELQHRRMPEGVSPSPRALAQVLPLGFSPQPDARSWDPPPTTFLCTPLPPPTHLHPTNQPRTPASPHPMCQHRPCAIQSRTRSRLQAASPRVPCPFPPGISINLCTKNSQARALGRAVPGHCGFPFICSQNSAQEFCSEQLRALPG